MAVEVDNKLLDFGTKMERKVVGGIGEVVNMGEVIGVKVITESPGGIVIG